MVWYWCVRHRWAWFSYWWRQIKFGHMTQIHRSFPGLWFIILKTRTDSGYIHLKFMNYCGLTFSINWFESGTLVLLNLSTASCSQVALGQRKWDWEKGTSDYYWNIIYVMKSLISQQKYFLQYATLQWAKVVLFECHISLEFMTRPVYHYYDWLRQYTFNPQQRLGFTEQRWCHVR